MIRTFRIFKLETFERSHLTESSISPTIRFSDLASIASKPLSRKLADLNELLKNERLELVSSGPPYWEFQFSGLWKTRPLSVSVETAPFVSIRVLLWIRWLVPWLIIFEANRGLSEAVSRLVAASFARGPGNVKLLSLDSPHWQALKDWIEEDSSKGGAILGGRFYKATVAGVPVESITIRCLPDVENRLIVDSFQSAGNIGEVFFQTPLLKSIDRNISCRINRHGMVHVYGEEITDEIIESLLKELESIWGFLPEK